MDEPRVGVYDLPLVAYNIDDPHGKPGLRKYFSAEVLRIIVATAMGPMESSQVEDFSLTVTKHVLEEWRKDKWGGGYGIECFPVVVCRSLSEDLKTWIRGYVAPKHWQASELPVLASLNDRELYFCEKTPMWGGLMWGGLRKSVRILQCSATDQQTKGFAMHKGVHCASARYLFGDSLDAGKF